VNAVSEIKTLPHNLEAEQALLGCLLFDNKAYARVEGVARGDDFYEPFHGKLFREIERRIKRGGVADPAVLHNHFTEDRAYTDLGGIGYLATLIDRAPPPQRAPDYAAVISEMATRRLLIRSAQAMVVDAQTVSGSVGSVIVRSEDMLTAVARGAGGETHWLTAEGQADYATAVLDGRERPQYVPTGYAAYDEKYGGIRAARMLITAGRPGMGKSAEAVERTKRMARAGFGVGFQSLEMDKAEIILRLLCSLAHDPALGDDNPTYFAAQRGKLSTVQETALRRAGQELRELPIWIDDRSGLTPSEITPAVKRLIRDMDKRGVTPGMVVIDHLHIVRPDNAYGSRVVEVGEVSGALRDLARETGVAVNALCQLSRENEKRTNVDKRPQMSDLRWSGEIEADANTITFLHRPEKYLKEPIDKTAATYVDEYDKYLNDLDRWKNRTLLINVKNRGGPSDFEYEIHSSLPHNAYWE
jgi:replicative DNA helicase